jgi:hypothetical protein
LKLINIISSKHNSFNNCIVTSRCTLISVWLIYGDVIDLEVLDFCLYASGIPAKW